MLRLLLLVPTTTYRTENFVEAARKLDVDLVVASERPNVLAERLPDNLLTLDFNDPDTAAREVAALARLNPFSAVVPVDARTTVVGAAIANALGLPSNPVAAVAATRNKYQMRLQGALEQQGHPKESGRSQCHAGRARLAEKGRAAPRADAGSIPDSLFLGLSGQQHRTRLSAHDG